MKRQYKLSESIPLNHNKHPIEAYRAYILAKRKKSVARNETELIDTFNSQIAVIDFTLKTIKYNRGER
jgi:hypothetical protein